jgi:hypothetical protein
LGKAGDLVAVLVQTGQLTMYPLQEAAEPLGKEAMAAQRLVYRQHLVAAVAARVQWVQRALALQEARGELARNLA